MVIFRRVSQKRKQLTVWSNFRFILYLLFYRCLALWFYHFEWHNLFRFSLFMFGSIWMREENFRNLNRKYAHTDTHEIVENVLKWRTRDKKPRSEAELMRFVKKKKWQPKTTKRKKNGTKVIQNRNPRDEKWTKTTTAQMKRIMKSSSNCNFWSRTETEYSMDCFE